MNVKECPVCKGALKVIPAGVSKMSGKPYPSFYSCPSKCNLKGIMDTRVVTDNRPAGWEDLGKKLGKESAPREDSMKSDVIVDLLTDISAKIDRMLEKQSQINVELGE